MRKVLLIGAGSKRSLLVPTPLKDVEPVITTLDIEPSHRTDVVWDLNNCPWPFEDDVFDEVHAYEVLEHLGQQGDVEAFFAHFGEIYRILKPGGYLAGSVPRHDHMWAWGDPSHRRIITEGTFTFLDQTAYEQVGKTTMSDFRSIWKGDFKVGGDVCGFQMSDVSMYFLIQAQKPARA